MSILLKHLYCRFLYSRFDAVYSLLAFSTIQNRPPIYKIYKDNHLHAIKRIVIYKICGFSLLSFCWRKEEVGRWSSITVQCMYMCVSDLLGFWDPQNETRADGKVGAGGCKSVRSNPQWWWCGWRGLIYWGVCVRTRRIFNNQINIVAGGWEIWFIPNPAQQPKTALHSFT